MTITVYGAFGTDTTMSSNLATYATVGGTFQINAYSQLTFQDGADPTVIEGDTIVNEQPNDPTQTLAGNAIIWDYTITVNDGTTNYDIGVMDYDLNGDGQFNWPTAEQGYFLVFVGDVPPLGTTLTVGSVAYNGPSIPVDTTVPCFTRGTRIETPDGPVPVETLRAGDRVLTLDHGAQQIRWAGSRRLSRQEALAVPGIRPIRIAAGALGLGLPERDLLVSPQHRMLLNSAVARRMFDTPDVFLPANKLVGCPGIAVEASEGAVEYFHLLFDRHEVVFAEGAPTESLFVGPEALKSVGTAALAEIAALFPQFGTADHRPVLARKVPETGKRMKRLVARILANGKPLLERLPGAMRPRHQDGQPDGRAPLPSRG